MAQTIDLRSALGAVRSQGQRGTCLAFAVTAAHELHIGDGIDRSIETLYWGAKQFDRDNDPGTTFESADQALRKWGQPAEALWPYDPTADDRSSAYAPPASAIDPANCHLAALDPCALDRAAVEALLENSTVIAIGVPTWSALRRPADGHLRNPAVTDRDGGFHVMVIVGHRRDTNEILLRNSWGDEGYAWIPFAFIADHVLAAWSISTTAGTSRPVGPTLTKTRYGNQDDIDT